LFHPITLSDVRRGLGCYVIDYAGEDCCHSSFYLSVSGR
jgi:hypothetical protein